MHFGCNHNNSNNNWYIIVNLFPAGPKCLQILFNVCMHALTHMLTCTHAHMHAHTHAHTHTHTKVYQGNGTEEKVSEGRGFQGRFERTDRKKQRTTIINTLMLVFTLVTVKEITLHYDNLHWTLHIHTIFNDPDAF